MNKYKKGFTPNETALISIGIESYIKNEHWPSGNLNVHCLNELRSTVRYIICDLDKLEFETLDEKYKTELDKFTYLEDELIPKAEDLKNALIAETLLTQQYEQGSSPKKSLLEIYVPFYDVKFNGEFDPEKTQLTKESLAKWFDEADEAEIANKFKPAKKIIPINPFKQSYTAEHAALIAVGLKTYDSIETAVESSEYQREEIANAEWQVERGGEYTDFEVNELLEDDSISNAINLKEALIDEIKLASEIEGYNSSLVDYYEMSMTPPSPPQLTDIVIYSEEINKDKTISYSGTLITKESVATWLLNNGQSQYAKNVMPNIESLLKEKELAESQRQKQWSQVPSSKTTDKATEKLIIENKELMRKVKELEDKNLDLIFKIPLEIGDNDLNHKVAKKEEINKNTFPSMTLKLQVMLTAQNKYWDNYNKNKISSQQEISNFIADELGLKITIKGTNRTADELAKAIQPDDVKRK